MGAKYWKVVLRYGHVGRRHEISVARYLQTDSCFTAIDVLDLASEMPGVKNWGVVLLAQIDEQAYLQGKSTESDNIYLQKLMTFNPKQQPVLRSEVVC